MRKKLYREVEIPEGIDAKLEENILTIKGNEGESNKKFKTPRMIFEIKENKIIIGSDTATKREKKLMNTACAHIKNMIKGVQEKFEYKLKVCSSHFPMTIEINNKEITIKNFLGEKIPRKATIQDEVEIEKEGDFIILRSIDKEKAGQSAGSIERATRLSKKDRRVFQDGIYIINKPQRIVE